MPPPICIQVPFWFSYIWTRPLSASPMECAIVLFPIPRADLEGHELALDNLGI
jgi:hypothetical protein